jgi:DNA (cytosine-5)-methyltransferase 1
VSGDVLNGLDLFSGIGGIALALSEWVKPIAYCENERYAQGVLLSRMRSGELPVAPIWDDVRTLSRESLLVDVDVISGGFPCQDISVAGNGAGLAGERSGLYFEIRRLVSELRPRFVFLENVPAITLRGLEQITLDFTQVGYDTRWTIISAAEIGAPHLRERWWLLAHDSSKRWGQDELLSGEGRKQMGDNDWCRADLGHTKGQRPQGPHEPEATWRSLAEHRSTSERDWPPWLVKPALPRGNHGLQMRVDRTRGLGNAVVPKQARTAFMRLMGIEL